MSWVVVICMVLCRSIFHAASGVWCYRPNGRKYLPVDTVSFILVSSNGKVLMSSSSACVTAELCFHYHVQLRSLIYVAVQKWLEHYCLVAEFCKLMNISFACTHLLMPLLLLTSSAFKCHSLEILASMTGRVTVKSTGEVKHLHAGFTYTGDYWSSMNIFINIF